MSDDELDHKRFDHEARLAWFKAWSPLVMTAVTGVAAYLTVDLHNQRMDIRKLKLEQARFSHEVQMESRTFERDTNQRFIQQFLAQDDEVKRLALIDFVHQTAKDEGLRGWAKTQKDSVAGEVAELRKALAQAEAAKAEALQAQLEQFKREQEAQAAAEAAEAELVAARSVKKGQRGSAKRRAQAAKAAAAQKAKAARAAAERTEQALAAAEVAEVEAASTEARVRGRGPTPAGARTRQGARAPDSDRIGGAAAKAPPGPVFQNYTCRCGLKTQQVAAPDERAAKALCKAMGRLCRFKPPGLPPFRR